MISDVWMLNPSCFRDRRGAREKGAKVSAESKFYLGKLDSRVRFYAASCSAYPRRMITARVASRIHFAHRIYMRVCICVHMHYPISLSGFSFGKMRCESPERFALASRDTALFSLRALCAAHGVRCNLQSPRNELVGQRRQLRFDGNA